LWTLLAFLSEFIRGEHYRITASRWCWTMDWRIFCLTFIEEFSTVTLDS